jgi:CHAT domain-containing protein/tetratricopeptide (TPR) repeat protein
MVWERLAGRARSCGRAFLTVALTLLAPRGAALGQAPDPAAVTLAPGGLDEAALEPGRPVRQSLAGGQTRTYRFELAMGQFLRVRVEQEGIEVLVRLRDPAGKVLTESSDRLRGPAGQEQLSIISQTSGSYRLEIQSTKPQDPPGHYQVVVKDLRAGRDTDAASVAAERGFDEAMRLRAEDTAESRRRAIAKFLEVVPLWQAAGEPDLEARTLQNLGETYGELGEKREALSYFEKALTLMQRSGDRLGEADVRDDLGNVCDRLGEYQKALDHYRSGLAIYRALGRRADEAAVLGDLGWLLRNMGLFDQALDAFQTSLPVVREVGDRMSEGTTLNNIGLVFQDRGDDRRAIEYFLQAMAVHAVTGNRTSEAATLHNIGLAYVHLGEYGKAPEYLEKSLQICRTIGERYGEAYVLSDLGIVAVKTGEPSKALTYFQEALPLRRQVGDLEGEATTLRQRAMAYRQLGDLEGARRDLEAALSNYEILRGNVLSPDQRSSFFTWVRPAYDSYIDLLLELHCRNPAGGFDALALAASEKARARSLLELLAESGAGLQQGVDASLLEREHELQQELRGRVEHQVRILAGKHDAKEEEAARKAVETTRSEIEQVEDQIRAASPQYAALTQPQPLVPADVARELDADTILLEYALGQERSVLWVVSQGGLSTYELPRRAEIESAARAVYEQLRVRPKGGRDLDEFWSTSQRLTEMVLKPVTGLSARKRLVIVADGALQLVPFGVLPLPRSDSSKTRPVPLVVDHEVVSLPSASTLAVLRRGIAGRPPAPRTLAVIADPVFDKEDPRLKGRAQRKSGKPVEVAEASSPEADRERSLVRSVSDFGDSQGAAGFSRLPFTRREAVAILSLVPASERKVALDFDASRSAATSPALSQYRFVHFATHGLINTVHPELSGIVLSLVDRQAHEQDGFLPGFEIFNLKLSADLVVLSACRTALGKDVRGEGLVGLTRAFLYAGAARVVASLWTVDDRATSELMKGLYGEMLGPGRLPPAAALRATQVALWRQPRWEHPYYWGAFILQGEWK